MVEMVVKALTPPGGMGLGDHTMGVGGGGTGKPGTGLIYIYIYIYEICVSTPMSCMHTVCI